jgi:hypothetical protein
VMRLGRSNRSKALRRHPIVEMKRRQHSARPNSLLIYDASGRI